MSRCESAATKALDAYGNNAAGIGSAFHGSCGAITIYNTVKKVVATRGVYSDHDNCSIGKVYGARCGDVTIGGEKYFDGATETYLSDGADYLRINTITYEP